MKQLLRRLKAVAAIVLACSVGTLPSCGTMGGGMRYVAPELPLVTASLA